MLNVGSTPTRPPLFIFYLEGCTMAIDINEINTVTNYTIERYNIKWPTQYTRKEFLHEVVVYMFFKCKLEKPGAAAIIKNVRWTAVYLYKKHGDFSNTLDFDPACPSFYNTEELDATEEIKNILNLAMTKEDKDLIKDLATGMTGSEIARKMGVSRATYHARKNKVFSIVRASCEARQKAAGKL